VVGQDAPDTVIDLRAAFDDPEDADVALRIAVTANSNPGLFSAVTVNASGALTLDYAPGVNGVAQLVVTATDTGGQSTASAFSVVVSSPAAPLPPAPPVPPTGQPAAPGPGSITGALFDDADASGRRSRGEPPLAGVRLFLDADGDGAYDAGETTATTGADGSFTITNLAAGVYRVRAQVPAGRAGGAADVIVRGKARPVRVKPLGVSAAGALAGSVFVDSNVNGARDAGEAHVRGARVFSIPTATACGRKRSSAPPASTGWATGRSGASPAAPTASPSCPGKGASAQRPHSCAKSRSPRARPSWMS
jgi:hypothetical protein